MSQLTDGSLALNCHKKELCEEKVGLDFFLVCLWVCSEEPCSKASNQTTGGPLTLSRAPPHCDWISNELLHV